MTEKRFKINSAYSKSLQELIGVIRDNDEDMYMTDVVALLNSLSEENEYLKQELKGTEELLRSYQKTVKHDAKLLADATKNGYLPPLEGWREI